MIVSEFFKKRKDGKNIFRYTSDNLAAIILDIESETLHEEIFDFEGCSEKYRELVEEQFPEEIEIKEEIDEPEEIIVEEFLEPDTPQSNENKEYLNDPISPELMFELLGGIL